MVLVGTDEVPYGNTIASWNLAANMTDYYIL